MTALTADDFSAFFADVNGHDPFPWQRDLVHQVLREGHWPSSIDVPTGLGKTSMIDIAFFVLAASYGVAGSAHDAGRRRVFFVVDRRIVVDEAYEHALRVADVLALGGTNDTTAEVARRLVAMQGPTGGPRTPLQVTRMRGGTTWDQAWLNRPDLPALVLGTIDQVGSRLFFRGYGASDGRRPIDAALVGTDSLILIDEAHLAESLVRSVATAFGINSARAQGQIAPAATVIQLSATPATTATGIAFDFDRNAHLAHPVARRRLLATKHMHPTTSTAKHLPGDIAKTVVSLLTDAPNARVLVVCNTVVTARATHSAVQTALAEASDNSPLGDAELLIGRSRPCDRDRRMSTILERFGLARTREQEGGVNVLVATQTVEVGANLDADYLITESAPLSSLVQRLGRLNRLGDSRIQSPQAIVVHDGEPSPVYGDARDEAWRFLTDRVGEPTALASAVLPIDAIDASPLALRELMTQVPEAAIVGERPVAPLLSQPLLRSWARTRPAPDTDTPVAPYLHGLDSGQPEVRVVWRDGVLDDRRAAADARLKALPVVGAETLSLPYRAVVGWLAGGARVPVSDLESDRTDEADSAGACREALVRRGDDWRIVTPPQIRPGDTIVVPSDYGGVDEFGWDPTNMSPVIDRRDTVGATPVLRIDDRTLERILKPRDDAAESSRELRDAVHTLLRFTRQADDEGDHDDLPVLAEALETLQEELARAASRQAIVADYGACVDALAPEAAEIRPSLRFDEVPFASSGVIRLDAVPRADEADDDSPLDSSTSDRPVSLSRHHRAVADRAAGICAAIGLDGDLTELVVFAAANHDLGKLDLRFQAALLDGDPIRAELLPEPLAKSGVSVNSSKARAARARSNLPRGFRHEAWSAHLVTNFVDDAAPTWHRDLVVHLVASHHGWSRPRLPPVLDPHPQTVTWNDAAVTTYSELSVDLTAPSRFERLNDRYGVWGLALLETIVRGADQTCSAEGT